MKQQGAQHLGRRLAVEDRRLYPKDSELGAGGFTIVELLIASTIFSIVILVALSGFIQIGRLFYKGLTITHTQQTLRNVVDNVTTDVTGGSTIYALQNATGTGNRKYYCVGNARYIFKLSNKVDSVAEAAEMKNVASKNWQAFGLLRDQLPGSSGCADPFDPTNGTPPQANVVELLNDKMRLNQFCIDQDASLTYGHVYDINVTAVTGDDSSLNTGSDPSAAPCATKTPSDCNAALNISRFCSVSSLSATATAESVQ